MEVGGNKLGGGSGRDDNVMRGYNQWGGIVVEALRTVAKDGPVMQSLDPALLWFLVGFALVLAEFAAPGIILIFIGLGAWVVSLAVWLGWLPALGAQIAVFAVSSLMLLLGLRRFFKNWFMGFSEANPNAQGNLDEFVGKTVTALSAVVPGGTGKVEFKGAQWQAACAEALQPGDPAVIERVDGLCLIVRRKN